MARSTIKNTLFPVDSTINIYLDPTGNDVLGDGSITNPWQTITRLIEFLKGIRANGTNAEIFVQFADGTYTDPFVYIIPHGMDITLKGNDSDPSLVKIQGVLVEGTGKFVSKFTLDDITLLNGMAVISCGFDIFQCRLEGNQTSGIIDCEGRWSGMEIDMPSFLGLNFQFSHSEIRWQSTWDIQNLNASIFALLIHSDLDMSSVTFTGAAAPISDDIRLQRQSLITVTGASNPPSSVIDDDSLGNIIA